MNMIRQIVMVTLLNLRSLPTRAKSSLVIVIGMACVIGVLLSMLSLVTGLAQSFADSGDPARAIVMVDGSTSELWSKLPRANAATIINAPGIARDKSGAVIAEPQILSSLPATRSADGIEATMQLKGIGSQGVALQNNFRIVAGRMFRAGSREMVVGLSAQQQFANLKVGDKIIMPDGEWPIVGTFTTGDLAESQLFADRDTLMAALRSDTFSSLTVRLTSPAAFPKFKSWLTTNPALSLMVERQSEFYARTTQQLAFLGTIGYVVAGIMGLGALFGAINTMYTAVSARRREIATLRALGFNALAVAISVIGEALLLSLAGAAIGTAMAMLLFDGKPHVFGPYVFNLAISSGLIGLGLVWTVAIALLGGFLPSIRAARMSVVDALRAT